jgi:hypothetical protein
MISYKNYLDILVEETKSKKSTESEEKLAKCYRHKYSLPSKLTWASTKDLIQFWSKYSLKSRAEIINNEFNARKMSLKQTKYKFSLNESDLVKAKLSNPNPVIEKKKFSLIPVCTQKRKCSNLIKNSVSVGCLTSQMCELNQKDHRNELNRHVRVKSESLKRSKSENDLRRKRVFKSKKHFSCCDSIFVKNLIRKFESFEL